MSDLVKQLEEKFGGTLRAIPELQEKVNTQGEELISLREAKTAQEELITELYEKLKRNERIFSKEEPGIVLDHRGNPRPRVSRDMAEFVRKVITKETRELSTSVGADGGFLVPEDRVPELVQLITNYGQYRQDALVVPMAAQTQKWPSLASGVTAYWIAENNAAIESFPTFAETTMQAQTLVGLTHVSAQLLEDADTNLASLLIDLFARAIAKEEDIQGFKGTGAGSDPFFGVLNAAGVNVVTMDATETGFTNVNAGHLLSMTGAVPSNLLGNAKFYLHRSVFEQVRTETYADGRYVWQPGTPQGPVSTLWGYPYELVEVMPTMADSAISTRFVIFGDMRNAYLGERHQQEVARSEHYAFNKLQTHIRVHERVAIKVAEPSAFAVLETAAA